MSKITCVELGAKALMDPVVVGTIAMLPMIAPSEEFSVETNGRVVPCGHKVR